MAVSIGIACSDEAGSDAEQLARNAHRAMYAAKRRGRDRCVVFDAMLDGSIGTHDQRDGPQLAAVLFFAETLDLRDPSTSRHSQTVANHAREIALALGLSAEHAKRVHAAGLVHDIGKVAISDGILHKPGPLTPAEWVEIRRHPEVGAQILREAQLLDLASWVLAHHERIDGRGYPHGISEPQIPMESRILAVADAYEAMTADRPYRRGLTEAAARAELERCVGSQFDADIVSAFLAADPGRQIVDPSAL